jgi:hypothetical protein
MEKPSLVEISLCNTPTQSAVPTEACRGPTGTLTCGNATSHTTSSTCFKGVHRCYFTRHTATANFLQSNFTCYQARNYGLESRARRSLTLSNNLQTSNLSPQTLRISVRRMSEPWSCFNGPLNYPEGKNHHKNALLLMLHEVGTFDDDLKIMPRSLSYHCCRILDGA